jgi:hypothetical protein
MSKNAVAVKEEKSTAVAIASDFEAFAGMGMEQVSTEDMSVPFLRILAQLSPQVNKRDGAYVEGAEPGFIYNTVANEAYDGDAGIQVIPCYYSRRLVEWKPREKGGGYVGSYAATDPIANTTYRDDRGNDVLPNGNLLSNTAQFFVILLHPTMGPQRCLITMTSTQLKKARKWVTQMQSLTATGKNGNMYTMPMMSQVYKLRTVEERNDKGSWFGWEISRVGPVEDKNIFNLAVEFSKSVAKGEVQVKEEQGADDTRRSSGADEDAPF